MIKEKYLEAASAALPEFATDELAVKLDTLAAHLSDVGSKMNLTAITQPDQVALLHLADCVSLLKVADLKGKKLIDVGCGAGFPGVPLKIACPELDLTLLDSLGKRMHWLEEILPTLGIDAQYVIG